MSEPILQLSDATKIYAGKYALDHITLELYRGRIYGLIGVNGAGKTTMMRIISGLSPLDSGNLTLFGLSAHGQCSAMRNRMGFLIEAPIFYDNLTLMQNLRVMQILRGTDCDLAPIVTALGLDRVEKKKKAESFSLGMKQRLGLAMALTGTPEFLLLDEPLNALDPLGIMDMRNLIQKFNQEMGITILLSSHLLSELWQVATDYIFLHEGKIVECITAAELEQKLAGHGKNKDDLENYFFALIGGRTIRSGGF